MDYRLVEKIEEFGSFQEDLGLTEFISLDSETTSLDTLSAELLLLQIRINNHTYIFNCKKLGGKYVNYIVSLVKESNKIVIIQNAKYDIEVIKTNTGTLLEKVHDTFVTEIIITNGLGTRFPSLFGITKKYEGIELEKSIRLDFIDENFTLEEKHLEYSALDVLYLESIYHKQIKEVIASKQEMVYELEMKFVPVLAQMELNGVYLNIEKWKEVAKGFQKRADEEEHIIKEYFLDTIDLSVFENLLQAVETIQIAKDKEGKDLKAKFRKKELEKIVDVNLARAYLYTNINIDSHNQVKNLINLTGILEVTNTQAGTLKKLYSKLEIARSIVEYREFKKRVSTYGDKFTSRVHQKTGRIHAKYHQAKTASGRMACEKPNMQNIPAEDDYRTSFEAEPGFKFITIDYSQQEYRIIGEFTGEQKIIDAYNAGADLHIVTASLLYNVPLEAVTKEQRDDAKTVNFALFYGANEWGLKHRLGITLKEARRIMKAIFEGMPRFVSFRTAFENLVIKHLLSVTMTGRRRYFKREEEFIDGSEYMKWLGNTKREGFNHPIQGTGADMTKLAMCYCHYNNPFGNNFMLVTQGHDEIGFEVTEEIAEDALKFASAEMVKAGERFITTMPVEVEGHIKDHWSKG